MTDEYLKELRQYEFKCLQASLPSVPKKVLEVGAGNGWQSQLFLRAGYDIVAMDVVNFADQQTGIPVVVYDGSHFPFLDRQFDIVFTSNVLDHVPNMEQFSTEIHRVLKKDGQWILIVPTTAWRFWTLILLYFKFPTLVLAKFTRAKAPPLPIPAAAKAGSEPTTWATRTLLPRLGERGSAFTELFLFAHRARLRFFTTSHWQVARTMNLKLFYSGARIFGGHLPLRMRSLLASLLGCACRVYFLRNSDAEL